MIEQKKKSPGRPRKKVHLPVVNVEDVAPDTEPAPPPPPAQAKRNLTRESIALKRDEGTAAAMVKD